jgi:hypothetical protein
MKPLTAKQLIELHATHHHRMQAARFALNSLAGKGDIAAIRFIKSLRPEEVTYAKSYWTAFRQRVKSKTVIPLRRNKK